MDFIKASLVGLLSITLIQCSSAKKRMDAENANSQAAIVTPTVATPAAQLPPPVVEVKKEESSKELDELKVSLKKAEAIGKKDAPAEHKDVTNAEAKTESHRKAGAVTPEKALGWLKNGNARYTKGSFRKDGATKKDVERLAKGQSPHSIILSCSDSRVPPEVVFDQKLGEVFVVRTAGESLDSSVIASIEYAVEHLGSNLILVMGHTQCGAVKAALNTPAGSDAGSPYINALVAEIQPRLHEHARGPASENFVVEGWDNARGVSQKLLEKSKVIREAAKSGSLRVETALYHLESGKVEWNH